MDTSRRDSKPGLPGKFLHPRYWGIWLAIVLHAMLGRLPRRLRRKLGAWVGEWTYRNKAKRREITRLNIRWCFPHRDDDWQENLVRKSFHYQGAVLADVGLLWWANGQRFEDEFIVRGEEHLSDALARDERVILFTLHTHGMDLGGLMLTRRWPMMTYVNRMRNPLVEWIVAQRRGRFGGRVYDREAGMRPVIQNLKKGRIFYYPVDEDAHRGEGIFAPFFNVEKYTHTAPFRLARIGKARLIPCTTYYSDSEQRYVVQILPALEGVPSGDNLADAGRLNAAFEEMILLAPEQYSWGQRMFQTRPDGVRPY